PYTTLFRSLFLILAFGVRPAGAQSVIRGGATAFPLLAPNGLVTAPSLAFTSDPGVGLYHRSTNVLSIAMGGRSLYEVQDTQGTQPSVIVGSGTTSTAGIGFSSGSLAAVATDTQLYRDAANTLAQKNGANAQTFRIYGTTTGP